MFLKVLTLIVSLIDCTQGFSPSLTILEKPPIILNIKNGFIRKGVRIGAKPGDELFPEKGSSYVPIGLSKGEYEKIKKAEDDKLKKKNFGMWGPRFQQSGRPDGDWMVQPGLWTMGFGVNGTKKLNGTKNSKSPDGKSQHTVSDWGEFIRRHTPAFFTVYMMTQFLQYAIVMTASFIVNMKTSTPISLGQALQPGTIRTIINLLYRNWIVISLKLCTAAFFACPIELFVLERLNRKHLWSRKRSFWTISGLGVLGLLSYFGTVSVATTVLWRSGMGLA